MGKNQGQMRREMEPEGIAARFEGQQHVSRRRFRGGAFDKDNSVHAATPRIGDTFAPVAPLLSQ